MADLSTQYMGMAMSSPVVAAACPLSGTIDNIKRIEDAGAGALVIKSLFEEQIWHDMKQLDESPEGGGTGSAKWLDNFLQLDLGGVREHMSWLEKARQAVSMPLIASINAVSPGAWVEYTRQLANTGVDGIELNLYTVETDPAREAIEIEDAMFETFDAVKNATQLPVAVKLSPFYTSVANVVQKLVDHGAAAAVLFNRFLQPDIDPDTESVQVKAPLSDPSERRLPLRWIGLLYGRVGLDLAGNTGIHDAKDVARFILAGAAVTQLASALLRHGPHHVTQINSNLAAWMDNHSHTSLEEFRGQASQMKFAGDQSIFERAQYLDYVAASWTHES